MPHVRSAASRSMRTERAVARGYACVRPDGCAHIAVPSALVDRVKIMAKSLEFHAKHDSLSGHPHYHARLATAGASDLLDEMEVKHASSVHKAAGCAKHLVGVAAVAAKSGSLSKDKVLWADVDGDENVIKCGKEMNRNADEFVPQSPAEDSVPSLGAQLDWWIASLCGRIDALQLQNEKLSDELDKLKVINVLEEPQARNQDRKSEDVAGAVLEKVMQKLPSLVGPVVIKSVQSSLRESLAQSLPDLVSKAVDAAARSDGDTSSPISGDTLVEPKGNVTRLEPTAHARAEGQLTWAKDGSSDAPAAQDVSGAASKSGDAGVVQVVEEPVLGDVIAGGDGLRFGEIVCIDGLVSSPSLNGCVARIHGFDPKTNRYMLEIEHDKGIKKFRRSNFLTECDLDDLEGASSFSGTGCHDENKLGSNAAGGLGVLSAAPARL
jgi:hypothetical protein